MKKIIYLSLLLCSLSLFSQPIIHSVKLLGSNLNTARTNYCQNPFSQAFNYNVNINITNPLQISSIYTLKVDGYGPRFYKIVAIANSADPDESKDNLNIDDVVSGPLNFECNGFKYHRLLDLGSTPLEATNNYCLPILGLGSKTNILINTPLVVGNVYQIDRGNGLRYFKVTQAESSSNQDASENIDGINIGSPVTITCPIPAPDLQALSATTSSSSVNIGSGKSVNYSVKNIGDAVSNSSQFEFYLSANDNILSTNDILLRTLNKGAIAINETNTGSTSLTIPSNTNGGTYYIILKVTDNQDSNPNNDVVSSSSSFTVTTIPDSDGDGIPDNTDSCPNEAGPASNNGCPVFADLVIDASLSTAKSSGAPGTTQSLSSNVFHALYLGENLQILLFVKNIGEANSSSMKVGFYVTQGSSFSNATLLKENNYNGVINPNQSKSMSTEISGSAIASYANSNGSAYIHVRVDKDDSIDEGTSGGENNNIYSSIPVITFYTPR